MKKIVFQNKASTVNCTHTSLGINVNHNQTWRRRGEKMRRRGEEKRRIINKIKNERRDK